MKLFSLLLVALCATDTSSARAGGGESWRKDVDTAPEGNFPSLPGIRMHFAFGWSNILEAAKADAVIQRRGNEYRVVVSGGTEGLARTLWVLDAQHTSEIIVSPLRPERMSQVERYRTRTIETVVRYDATGLDRLRKTVDAKDPSRWKRFDFAPVYDILGGVLYVRSQPLRIGDSIGVVCFPGDSPYITVVKVEKRETIHCMGRDWPAIRLSLDVRKLEVVDHQPTKAVPYAKFRSGTVWVSDDALRIPLRAEVHIFVGFIYGELKSFEKL